MRRIYHIMPTKNGRYRVRREGSLRASAMAETLELARRRAIALSLQQVFGQIVVHNRDGTIAEEITVRQPEPEKQIAYNPDKFSVRQLRRMIDVGSVMTDEEFLRKRYPVKG